MYAVKPWGHVAIIGGTIESYTIGIGMRWRESNCMIVEKQKSPSYEVTMLNRCVLTSGTMRLLTDLGCTEKNVRRITSPAKGWRIITSDLNELRTSNHFPGCPRGEQPLHCTKGDLTRVLRSEFLRFGGSVEWSTTASKVSYTDENKLNLEKTYGCTTELEAVLDTTRGSHLKGEEATDCQEVVVSTGVVKQGSKELVREVFGDVCDVSIVIGKSAAAHCWLLPTGDISWRLVQPRTEEAVALPGVLSSIQCSALHTGRRVWRVSDPQVVPPVIGARNCVLGDGLLPVDLLEWRGDGAQCMIREASALCKELYGVKYHRGNLLSLLPRFSSEALMRRRNLFQRDCEDLAYFLGYGVETIGEGGERSPLLGEVS